MSAELRELVELARELKTLLEDMHKEGGDVEKATNSLREYERMIFRCAALSQKMFGSSKFSVIISRAIRIISTLRMLRTALSLLAGPVGWVSAVTGVAGVISAGMMAGDVMMEIGSG